MALLVGTLYSGVFGLACTHVGVGRQGGMGTHHEAFVGTFVLAPVWADEDVHERSIAIDLSVANERMLANVTGSRLFLSIKFQVSSMSLPIGTFSGYLLSYIRSMYKIPTLPKHTPC